MEIKALNQHNVQEIIKWKYNYPYDCYNYPEYNILKEQNWAIVNPKKCKKQFTGFFLKKELIAYFRIQTIKDYLLLGLGLKPEYCGKRLGKKIISKYIDYVKENYRDFDTIRLSVRKFNIRAIKCYKSLGFKLIKEDKDFFEMELKYEIHKNDI